LTVESFWSKSAGEIFQELKTGPEGLSSEEAERRLLQYGMNSIKAKKETSSLTLLLSQFNDPIILILLFATALSVYLKEVTDAFIIFAIVIVSGLLSFWQERGANNAVKKLLELVQIKAAVLRDREEIEIGIRDVVPGDIVILNAGDAVPGDCLIIESVSLFADESALTGETYPVEKQAGMSAPDAELASIKNCLWMGTHVISGTCKAVVVNTGERTKFGQIARQLKLREPETEFERGIRRFGYMLMVVTIVLVFSIFAINIIFKKPIIDAFMFSLALAVGLTPQLLPVIISNNLSRGAKEMTKLDVIVKRLSSIENLGSMNILCSDKTGTLTDGIVKLKDTLDASGAHSDKVLLYAYLNACFESGFVNPIDAAIRSCDVPDIDAYSKLDEEPYDFIRKRLSILVSEQKDGNVSNFIVTKGAFDKVVEICDKAETADGSVVDIDALRQEINDRYQEYSSGGYRTLGLAYKVLDGLKCFGRDDEAGMVFLGFIILYDPPKEKIADTISHLKRLGVSLKIITGDNRYIAANLMKQIGHRQTGIMTGSELRETSDIALVRRAVKTSVFAEVEPNQKERIIRALKKAGFVVGYMGDGINDVSAMHDADVSISVDSAVDVAKEAASIVLLEKNLDVLCDGILAGRRTFANTMKYVFMATSANFGNMFSMAGASLFLPFLPLLPKQVLLTNLLTDLPEMAIATDNVDVEFIQKPRRWDISFIKKFMLTFGLVSSVFDYITFGALFFLLRSPVAEFRTGWFVESVASAAIIVLVIRSRRVFTASKPGKSLVYMTSAVVLATMALPFTPLAGALGLSPLPPQAFLVISAIIILYVVTAELVKKIFYSLVKF
jgi:Mg2+-importing ATPase